MNKPPSELIALADELARDASCYQAGTPTRKLLHRAADALRTPATPPAQPAAAGGLHPSHVTRSSDASTYDEVCVNCGATDITGGGWGKLAEPCPSDHGKPDGAVRQALSALVNVVSNMRVPQNVADAALQVFVIGPVLERAKAALAGTSGDAPQITMADIRAHVGDGMVSSDDVIAAANALLRKHWAAETSPGDVLAMKEACKRAVTELDCMYVNDERVPYGGIPADPESSVWREAIKAAEAAIDRLDVKAEAKSPEPDAAVKPLEWGPYPHTAHASDDVAIANVSAFGGHKYQAQRDPDADGYFAFLSPKYGTWFWTSRGHLTIDAAKAAAQADYEQRIRSALIHTTTKPEAVAVKPKWEPLVKTVADLVNNLLTVDQSMEVHAAYFINYNDGRKEARTRSPSISRERVANSRINTGDETVPYSLVIWTSQDERPTTKPEAPAVSVEQLARTIATAKGVNPDCLHQNYGDEPVDHEDAHGRTFHYGWRNQMHIATAIAALIAGERMMSDLAERLDEARAQVVRLERQAAAATCAELGRHQWVSIGGCNCGCENGSCSVPVHECSVCKDCDYGENKWADETRQKCKDARS